jgi:peptidoglycan hydrolase-like amidase
LAQPYQSFSGSELYPTVEQKAARLCYGLVMNHAFIDGNKRIGTMAMLVFLAINGIELEYTQKELTRLVSQRLKTDLGDIIDLVPLERGKSGRIWKLRIVGTKGAFTIGKELEIRRTLSDTHLLSSCFTVEKTPGPNFILHGRGWGHGVGLCQIGAAVMGEQGFKYTEILSHYYRHSEIRKIYK